VHHHRRAFEVELLGAQHRGFERQLHVQQPLGLFQRAQEPLLGVALRLGANPRRERTNPNGSSTRHCKESAAPALL
jgi:hypothetical protein